MRSICYLVVVLVGISHVATGRSIQNNHGKIFFFLVLSMLFPKTNHDPSDKRLKIP